MENNRNEMAAILEDARGQFNVLLGNMFQFDDDDMAKYDECYKRVFRDGITFSYMSATFFAQFAAEILIAGLTSNPFRRFITAALDAEAGREGPTEYWHESMHELRFGLPGVDYTQANGELLQMMNDSYMKILSMNEWYGKPDGQKEFEMFCLSNRAIRDLKRMAAEFPYLIRRYDNDHQFAGEIMEYAGIVAEQIRRSAEGDDASVEAAGTKA